MSENEKQDLTENDCDSDDGHTENLEVETSTSDNRVQVSHGSSRITNRNLQQPKTEVTEVFPNDVITVEQLPHESLGKSSSENLECTVIYEFPSADESENASFGERKESKVSYEFLDGHDSQKITHLSEACLVSSHKVPQESDHAEHRSVPQIAEKRKDKLVKIFDSKTLNEGSPDDTNTARTSRESERKRKKGSISLLQNKKPKEAESSSTAVTHNACVSGEIGKDENSDNSTDEFADIEDNVKDSSSSENNDLKAATDKAKQMPMKTFDVSIPQINERKNVSLDDNQSIMVNYEASSSNSNAFPNNILSDKAPEKSLLPSFLKGETIPVIKLSDDMKKKFELLMPTILEVRESDSDEHILQPKKSNSNPLIMKTSMVKRKDKCNVCNARLGLCAIKCRCGGYYCAKHRYDKEHNCTFDYKSMGAVEIQKNNPRIVAEKVRKL